MRELRHFGLIAVTGLLGLSFAAMGCEDTKPPATTSSSSSGSTSSSSSSGGGDGGTGGDGGMGGAGGAGGGMGSAKVDTAVTDLIPFDATPAVDADNVYIVGLDQAGTAVIAQAKMDGSAASKVLSMGAPLVAPLNIATSTDGGTLYVADPGAEDPAGNPGRIFSIANDGGTLNAVTNADGYRARGLEILSIEAKDVIYFAGTDPMGVPGVYKVPADNSGPVTVAANGMPFHDPSGIAVSAEGDIYACDTVQASDGLGAVISVKGGTAATVVTGIRAGFPCGVALLDGDKSLLVSALDRNKITNVLITIDLATNMSTLFSTGVETFAEPAGLHRAKQGKNTFAWSDSRANGGTVFRITYQ